MSKVSADEIVPSGRLVCGHTNNGRDGAYYSGTALCTENGNTYTESSSYTVLFTNIDSGLISVLGATAFPGVVPAVSPTATIRVSRTVDPYTSTTSDVLSLASTSPSIAPAASTGTVLGARPTNQPSPTLSHIQIGLSSSSAALNSSYTHPASPMRSRESFKIGLGVGLGVGIPVFAFVVYLLYHRLTREGRARTRKGSSRKGNGSARGEEVAKGTRNEVTKGSK